MKINTKYDLENILKELVDRGVLIEDWMITSISKTKVYRPNFRMFDD